MKPKTCLSLATLLATGVFATLLSVAPSDAAINRPLGQHCPEVGPVPLLPNNFCGCTWGAVYVDGDAVAGAHITLTFQGRSITSTTHLGSGALYPIYTAEAYTLGARLGDEVVISATVGAQTLTRTLRLAPNNDAEQQAGFAFPPSFFPSPLSQPSIVTAAITPARVTRGPSTSIVFSATTTQNGSADYDLIGYEWRSTLDGVLGSEPEFELPTALITLGTHTITVRSLDAAARWSQLQEISLTIDAPHLGVFLPMVARQ